MTPLLRVISTCMRRRATCSCRDRMEAVVNEWLWQDRYWLPPGMHWEDMEVMEGQGKGPYPLPRDLIYTLPVAFAFIAFRYVFERVIAVPLSKRLGVKDRIRIQAAPLPKLETFYKQKSRQPTQSEVASLGKQCGLSQAKIQTWFRHRRNQDRPSNTKKFCEASWRFVFYLAAFTAGLASLLDSPWFWDYRECWQGFPKQPVTDAHYWYYILELGFYLSLLLCVSVDVKRKSAKMFHYAGWTRTCDSLFVVFALVFLVTRLVVFPCRVIHTTLVVSLEFFQPFFGYFFFNSLLLVLQALHIFWAYLILRMVYKFAFMGKVERDERSDEESEADEDEQPEEECDESSWEQRKGSINSKLASLANNCVLNNLTNQRNLNSRLPKAR
ncbi:ceramide synthase 4a isoform X3 [Dunckerocampus dactyliophorus]|uniref:ceramide synthase 4a isoform X3 n=1 Tax=Dunckerocampus dactyliophorus TaxID=161453 RepID=UPI0024059FB6|nr:ceramide synthase 4a isoform X3 [Dunckerocampus dactyliophorus]